MKKIKTINVYYFLLLFIFSVGIGFFIQKISLIRNETENLNYGVRNIKKNENPEKYASELASKCDNFSKKDKEKYACLQSVSQVLVDQVSFKTIVKTLENSEKDCHDLMHNVVNAKYKKGAKLPEIWQQCSSTCFGACYHGGFEGMLSKGELSSKNDAEVNKSLTELCDSVKNSFKNINYQCFHGVGHALMLFYDGDLPKSLIGCDKVAKEGWSSNCYGGVFMENLPNSTTTAHITKRYINDEDPLYPCNAIEKKYQAACYSFQTSHFFSITNRDIPAVIRLCEKIPDEYRGSCFSQIGLMHINYKSSDQSKAKQVCDLIEEGVSRASCIKGIISGYSDRFPENLPEMKSKGIFEVCAGVELAYKEPCYTQIGDVLRGFISDPDERKKECIVIAEPKYNLLCQSGRTNVLSI